jgi:ADP-ribosylglycohydrolase
MTTRLDRFQGCIVGLAVGDALGFPSEFLGSLDAIRAQFGPLGITGFEPTATHPAGTFSDDTQMTLAVTRALLASGHHPLDPLMESLAHEFILWAHSAENDRAPGSTCMQGCAALAHATPWRQAGVPTSKGCGAAMRAAPFGLFYPLHSQLLLERAAAQSALTHRHPTAIASSVALAAAVAHALSDLPLSSLLRTVRVHVDALDLPLLLAVGADPALSRTLGTREMLSALDAVPTLLSVQSDDVCALHGAAWTGESAVACALHCLLSAPNDFRSVVLSGANSSGDSDSIACMAGALSGARLGLHAIPADWTRDVEHRPLCLSLASDLCQQAR